MGKVIQSETILLCEDFLPLRSGLYPMAPLRGPRTLPRSETLPSGSVMEKMFIAFGLALLILGLAWPTIQKLGLGRLPGDILIERENNRIYIPIATSLLVSVVLSFILWIIGR